MACYCFELYATGLPYLQPDTEARVLGQLCRRPEKRGDVNHGSGCPRSAVVVRRLDCPAHVGDNGLHRVGAPPRTSS